MITGAPTDDLSSCSLLTTVSKEVLLNGKQVEKENMDECKDTISRGISPPVIPPPVIPPPVIPPSIIPPLEIPNMEVLGEDKNKQPIILFDSEGHRVELIPLEILPQQFDKGAINIETKQVGGQTIDQTIDQTITKKPLHKTPQKKKQPRKRNDDIILSQNLLDALTPSKPVITRSGRISRPPARLIVQTVAGKRSNAEEDRLPYNEVRIAFSLKASDESSDSDESYHEELDKGGGGGGSDGEDSLSEGGEEDDTNLPEESDVIADVQDMFNMTTDEEAEKQVAELDAQLSHFNRRGDIADLEVNEQKQDKKSNHWMDVSDEDDDDYIEDHDEADEDDDDEEEEDEVEEADEESDFAPVSAPVRKNKRKQKDDILDDPRTAPIVHNKKKRKAK